MINPFENMVTSSCAILFTQMVNMISIKDKNAFTFLRPSDRENVVELSRLFFYLDHQANKNNNNIVTFETQNLVVDSHVAPRNLKIIIIIKKKYKRVFLLKDFLEVAYMSFIRV